MKKYFTIPIACLLLITGMHVTISRHFCGGELASSKVSITGIAASCGMVHDEKSTASSEAGFSSNCCQNEKDVYSVDENYSNSVFHFKEITQNILHVFSFPGGFSFLPNYPSLTNFANVSPPDNYMANSVSMADICIFRI